jgi:hypothetical protein
MSNHSPLSNESITPSSPDTQSGSKSRHWLVRTLKRPTQFLAFWTAITLPFVHVPLLARGLGDPGVLLVFVLLLTTNVVALYVGHGHNQR